MQLSSQCTNVYRNKQITHKFKTGVAINSTDLAHWIVFDLTVITLASFNPLLHITSFILSPTNSKKVPSLFYLYRSCRLNYGCMYVYMYMYAVNWEIFIVKYFFEVIYFNENYVHQVFCMAVIKTEDSVGGVIVQNT